MKYPYTWGAVTLFIVMCSLGAIWCDRGGRWGLLFLASAISMFWYSCWAKERLRADP